MSILGVAPAQLTGVRVSGSETGVHAGRLAPYSQGDGASFLSTRPYRAGELVSVSGTAAGVPFSFSFTIGTLDPIARLLEPGVSGGAHAQVDHFLSRPDLTPARISVRTGSAAALAEGDIFLSTYPGPGETGPTILDPRGRLVYFKALPSGTFATNVRVQRYAGRPVLTWWQGRISRHGFGYGEGEIYSSAYRPVASVHAGNGLSEDLHELQLSAGGVAWITAWKPLRCDLAAVGGRADAAAYDTVLQAIDVRTGLVRYEWDPLDHVALSDSYTAPAGASAAWPWDWFHLNSIALTADGGLLLSARSTWTLYEIDARSGTVRWRLGGRESSFTLGPGAMTAWQHDARQIAPDEFSVFDNAGPPSGSSVSAGLVLRIDPASASATLLTRVTPPRAIFAETQGDLQLLANGDWWLGFGDTGAMAQLSPTGQLRFEAFTPRGAASYRTLRFSWSATPTGRPALAVRRPAGGGQLELFASWNGATAVARWRLRGSATTLPSSGFETELRASAAARSVQVEVLDARGRVLGRSAALTLAPAS